MNPALLLPSPSVLNTAMRSAAVNVPLVAALIGGVALLWAWVEQPSSATQNKAFLKALLTSKAPNDLMLQYLDADDPIALAKSSLATADDAVSGQLRTALAATM